MVTNFSVMVHLCKDGSLFSSGNHFQVFQYLRPPYNLCLDYTQDSRTKFYNYDFFIMFASGWNTYKSM